MAADDAAKEIAALERRLRRERAARQEAEAIAERVTRQLFESVQQLAVSHSVLDETADFVAVTDVSGLITYANRAFGALVGLDPAQLAKTRAMDLLDRASRARFRREVQPVLVERGLWRGELVVDRRDGQAVPVSLVVVGHTRPDGQLERVSFVARDITEERALHDQLSRDAHHDPLTGLPNRRVFFAELERTIELARSSGAPVVSLYIDLDGFKLVNDSFGHEAGDQVLKIVAQRLQQHLRHRDVLARMGGDEFALLCPELTSEQAALDIADRLTEAIKEPMNLEGVAEPVRIGMSTGIAFAHGAHLDAETIVRRADAAMYDAKHDHDGGYRLVNLTVPAPRAAGHSATQ